MRKLFLFITLAILCATTVQANDGSSGCGPGWYLFKENSLVSSALRATTNGILFPVVTIGMTFGTSNCTQHKLVLKEKESLYFATQNHFELKGDIAKGQGEYLAAFSSTVGCPPSAYTQLQKQLKAGFSNVYPSDDMNPAHVLTEVYKVILSDQDLMAKCSLDAV